MMANNTRWMKRAQVQTQILMYVLAVIVGTMILVFGYNAVRGFLSTQDDVDTLQFKTELQTHIDVKASQYRTVNVFDYSVPSRFTSVCFADHTMRAGFDNQPKITDSYILENTIKDAFLPMDVFLLEDGLVTDMFHVGSIALRTADDSAKSADCFDIVDGYMQLRLEALGRQGVLVSEVQ